MSFLRFGAKRQLTWRTHKALPPPFTKLCLRYTGDLCLACSLFSSPLLSCPIISLSQWFILQLSTKYVLAGQIHSRIIPCLEKLAIKCFIYLPQEECVSDRGKDNVCTPVCHVCGRASRRDPASNCRGPSEFLWDPRGSSRERQRRRALSPKPLQVSLSPR